MSAIKSTYTYTILLIVQDCGDRTKTKITTNFFIHIQTLRVTGLTEINDSLYRLWTTEKNDQTLNISNILF